MPIQFQSIHLERAAWLMVALLVIGLLVMQGFHLTRGYYEPDPNAYLLSAKQLARHGSLAFDASDRLRFHEHMWVEWEQDKVYAKFPPGYPLLLAAGWRLGGDYGMAWISPLCGALGLLACFGLARRVASRGFALVAVFMLFLNPLLNFYDTYFLSHSASFAVAAWGMWLLWEWWLAGGYGRAFLAGLLLGFAPLVRYTDALLWVPAGIVVLLRLSGIRPVLPADSLANPESERPCLVRSLLQAAIMGVGALCCLIPLMIHHLEAFGSVFRTGYDFCLEQTAFKLPNLLENIPELLRQMNDKALFFVFPLAIFGLAVMVIRRRWEGLVLGSWMLVMLLIYGAYYWAPRNAGPIYIRFQIVALPAYIALAAYALDQLLTTRQLRIGVAAFMLLIVAAVNGPDSYRLIRDQHQRAQLQMTADAAMRHLPANAVILVDGPAGDYLQTVADFTVYKLEVFNPGYGDQLLRPGGPSTPRGQRDRAERLARFFGKNNQQLQQLKQDLIRRHLAEGQAVALVVRKGEVSNQLSTLGPDFKAERLDAWQSPCNWPGWTQNKPTWELNRLRCVSESAAP